MGLRTPFLAALCLIPLGLIPLAGAAFAQDGTQGRAMNDDLPSVTLTGYLFLPALSGRATAFEALPPADIDLSFSDVLKDLEGGLMGATEYRTGPFSILGDLMFTQVRPGGTLRGPLKSEVELRQRAWTVQGIGLYRVYATPDMRVDLGGGLRFWHLDNKASINSNALPYRTASQDKSWIDPVLAARLQARLADNWAVTAYADYGFSGVGSDKTWQVLGTVDYSWSENLSVSMGYRVLATDYEDGDFTYDVTMRGPVVGISYRF